MILYLIETCLNQLYCLDRPTVDVEAIFNRTCDSVGSNVEEYLAIGDDVSSTSVTLFKIELFDADLETIIACVLNTGSLPYNKVIEEIKTWTWEPPVENAN